MPERPPPFFRGGRLLIAVVVALGFVLLFLKLATAIYLEALWQGQAGYPSVFWRRVTWQWGGRVIAGLAVALLVFANLRGVAKTLGRIQIRRRFGNIEIAEQLPHGYVLAAMLGTAALLGLWFGAAVPGNLGLQTLLVLRAAPWGIQDPIMGRDLGFYVFMAPVLASVLTFALVALFMVFTLATSGYAATGALRWARTRVATTRAARLHLGIVLTAFLVLLGLRLWLARYLLLLGGNSGVQGIFGFADAQARLPALQTLAVICFIAAGGVLWGTWRNRGVPVAASLISVVAAVLVIGEIYPALVQRFRVEPNELVRETPYIEWNLRFTRMGFGLEGLEPRRLIHDLDAPVDWGAAARQFAGLPVWSEGALLTTFRQLEARYPYYEFSSAAIDRYPLPPTAGKGGEPRTATVAVSVREVDPAGIQDPNWQNLHLRDRYVAGMGAVAALASRRTAEGRPPMILSGIPPEFSGGADAPPDLELERPAVFVGSRRQLYAVINPSKTQFLAPDGTPGRPGVDFPQGIRLSSMFRTLALAWRFRDANLLFASELSDSSRLVFRRRVVDRVRAVAPFLRYPDRPYPVIAKGRIMWILEGFTATRAFPLAASQGLPVLRPVRYIRNSVKVIVDAITGDMKFYRVPVPDPLLDAYASAFPELLRPMEEMPDELRRHLRYSRQLLNLQAQVLLQYHQETAPKFHRQQDVWAVPQELAQGTNPVPYRPEFATYTLAGEDAPRFQLTTVFVPAGRQNLTAILAARTDTMGVPELVIQNVPVEDQVSGPRQVEALIEQDPQISQQFSLWRTGGSEVWTGHLHLVPAGRRLLYLEPVFLAAAADAIPELRRFVVSDGKRVAMTERLEDAVRTLSGFAGVQAPASGGSAARTTPAAAGAARWPAEALDLVRTAEDRLRAGDWKGFGEAWNKLRALLERLQRESRGG